MKIFKIDYVSKNKKVERYAIGLLDFICTIYCETNGCKILSISYKDLDMQKLFKSRKVKDNLSFDKMMCLSYYKIYNNDGKYYLFHSNNAEYKITYIIKELGRSSTKLFFNTIDRSLIKDKLIENNIIDKDVFEICKNIIYKNTNISSLGYSKEELENILDYKITMIDRSGNILI